MLRARRTTARRVAAILGPGEATRDIQETVLRAAAASHFQSGGHMEVSGLLVEPSHRSGWLGRPVAHDGQDKPAGAQPAVPASRTPLFCAGAMQFSVSGQLRITGQPAATC
jgi:hypothetical protein